MEEVSGGRMHYMFNRVGGLKEDLPAGWLGRARHAVAAVRAPAARDRGPGRSATRSSGPAPAASACCRRELVHAYGVSGPDRPRLRRRLRPAPRRALPGLRRAAGRAAGRDPRPRATAWPGSSAARAGARSRSTSPTPASTGCAALPPGPINVRLPKVLKVPEGTTYAWTENPLGINGYYLVSRGEKTPWRLKLRSASFNNIQVLPELLPGTPGRRHGGDPRLDVLRRRRHRQVTRRRRAPARRPRMARGSALRHALPRACEASRPACSYVVRSADRRGRADGAQGGARQGQAVRRCWAGAAVAAGSRGSESRSERGSSNGRSGRFASTVQASRSAGVASTAAAGSSAGRPAAGSSAGSRVEHDLGLGRVLAAVRVRQRGRHLGALGHVGRVAEGQLDQRHLQRDPADLGQLGRSGCRSGHRRGGRGSRLGPHPAQLVAQLGDGRPQGHHLRLQGSGTGPVPAAHHRGEEPAPGSGSAVPSSHGPGRYALRGVGTVAPRGNTSHVTLVT